MRNTIAQGQKPDCIGGVCLDPKELLKNFRQTLIDPDTPKSAMTRQSADGKKLKLVVGLSISPDSKKSHPY